jgi:hypothetical protein
MSTWPPTYSTTIDEVSVIGWRERPDKAILGFFGRAHTCGDTEQRMAGGSTPELKRSIIKRYVGPLSGVRMRSNDSRGGAQPG